MGEAAELMEVTIVGRAEEADGIIALELRATGGLALPAFAAGAHVDVHVAPGLVRQYSLCNNPSETHRYRLGILLDPNSRGGSAEIHRAFVVGRTIQIGGPRNHFRLVEAAKRSVLLAGGIGMTPLLAMAYRLQDLGADFDFHYCARTRSRAAFLGELARADFASRVHFHFDEGPEDQRLSLERALPDPGDDTHLYVCGPTGFMDYVTDGAKRLGYKPANVHVEHFSASGDFSGGGFTVVAARSGITAHVPPDRTIAQILAAHGIDVPLSCEQGVCGTCLTPVLEGVPDHRDLFQTDEEKAEKKQITLCCSRAKSDVLVLDI